MACSAGILSPASRRPSIPTRSNASCARAEPFRRTGLIWTFPIRDRCRLLPACARHGASRAHPGDRVGLGRSRADSFSRWPRGAGVRAVGRPGHPAAGVGHGRGILRPDALRAGAGDGQGRAQAAAVGRFRAVAPRDFSCGTLSVRSQGLRVRVAPAFDRHPSGDVRAVQGRVRRAGHSC